jgi:hypothetical protein
MTRTTNARIAGFTYLFYAAIRGHFAVLEQPGLELPTLEPDAMCYMMSIQGRHTTTSGRS